MLMFVLDGTSRMTGDCHVRFCERLRGETPLCLLGESLCAPRGYNFFTTKDHKGYH